MSICKAVIMGKVVRNPEKRYTTNDLAITSFAIDISESEEPAIIRVVTMGKLAEKLVDSVKKGNIVAVEGRLQTSVVKTADGIEKKSVELDARTVEVVGESKQTEETDKYSDEIESLDEKIETENEADVLIGEDEIPF